MNIFFYLSITSRKQIVKKVSLHLYSFFIYGDFTTHKSYSWSVYKKNVFRVDSCSIDTLKIELDEKYLYQKRIAIVVVIYTLRRFKGRKKFSRKYQN
jgi:hypothetical protein